MNHIGTLFALVILISALTNVIAADKPIGAHTCSADRIPEDDLFSFDTSKAGKTPQQLLKEMGPGAVARDSMFYYPSSYEALCYDGFKFEKCFIEKYIKPRKCPDRVETMNMKAYNILSNCPLWPFHRNLKNTLIIPFHNQFFFVGPWGPTEKSLKVAPGCSSYIPGCIEIDFAQISKFTSGVIVHIPTTCGKINITIIGEEMKVVIPQYILVTYDPDVDEKCTLSEKEVEIRQ